MAKLAKFFIVGTAALAAFGVKACGVTTVKMAPALASRKTVGHGAKGVARHALVNESALFDGLFGADGDVDSEDEVPLPTAFPSSIPSGAGRAEELSASAPVVEIPTFDVPQLPVGESDAELSARLAHEAAMREVEQLRWQQQQLQQVQAEQWRLQQQIHSPAGYPYP